MSNARLQQLLKFQENNPYDSFLLFAIAKEYEKLNKMEEALAFYQKITTHDPQYVGVYYHLGKLQEKLAETATAFATYKKGMEVARTIGDQHALSELAGAKLNLGDDEDFE